MNIAPPICPRCGWEHTVRSELAHTLVPCPKCGSLPIKPRDPQDAVTLTNCPACGEGMVTPEEAVEIQRLLLGEPDAK